MNESTNDKTKTRLSALALGLGFGISWALGVLFLGVLSLIFAQIHYGSAFIQVLSSVYIGYESTPKGILIGTCWAVVDGFIWGIVIAWIYNASVKLFCKC